MTNNIYEEYWGEPSTKQSQSWILPIEGCSNHTNGDCSVTLPDDFITVVGWKVGDTIEWVDNHDGSFTLNKINYEDQTNY